MPISASVPRWLLTGDDPGKCVLTRLLFLPSPVGPGQDKNSSPAFVADHADILVVGRLQPSPSHKLAIPISRGKQVNSMEMAKPLVGVYFALFPQPTPPRGSVDSPLGFFHFQGIFSLVTQGELGFHHNCQPGDPWEHQHQLQRLPQLHRSTSME